jgi:aspartate 4-decarboxylase
LPNDPYRAAYYAVLDIGAWARRVHGDDFVAWATEERVPFDIVLGLTKNYGAVVLNDGGFEGSPWSFRVSLANLPVAEYRKIGQTIAEETQSAVWRWQASETNLKMPDRD